MREINFDEWVKEYKPVKNHIETDAPYDGCMFETFGPELSYILKEHKTNSKKIWTLIEGDNEESWMISGYHLVDRLGYFITEIPVKTNQIIWVNDNEMLSLQEIFDRAMECGHTLGYELSKQMIIEFYKSQTSSEEISTGKAKTLFVDFLENNLDILLYEESLDKIRDIFNK